MNVTQASYVNSLSGGDNELRERLNLWHDSGFVVLKKAVSATLIDAYLADLEDLIEENHKHDSLAEHPNHRLVKVRELSRDEVHDRHVRFVDFHNASVAGKKLALTRPIVEFLGHVFHDQVVAMQSLTFRYGTEQHFHQDFAYVLSGIPSHLAAAWIALEDIHPDAGPLAYYPGSHRIRKFDWGNGLFFDERSLKGGDQFQIHIQSECDRLGLAVATFLPKKGDVFLWHSSLAHGGTPQKDTGRTRLSLAVHYSSVTAYARRPDDLKREPQRWEFNGGVLYRHAWQANSEDIFRRGEAL